MNAREKPRTDALFYFDGTAIKHTTNHSFFLPLTEIALIGEYTTCNGPYMDDWFAVIVQRDNGHWLAAPMCEEGDTLLKQLGYTLDHPLQIGLANSTALASRILWPAALAGRPLFHFQNVEGEGLFQRMKLTFLPRFSIQLSVDALSVVRGGC